MVNQCNSPAHRIISGSGVCIGDGGVDRSTKGQLPPSVVGTSSANAPVHIASAKPTAMTPSSCKHSNLSSVLDSSTPEASSTKRSTGGGECSWKRKACTIECSSEPDTGGSIVCQCSSPLQRIMMGMAEVGGSHCDERGEGQCDDWLAGLGNARRSSACCKAFLKLSMFLIAASRATGYGIGTDDRVWICQIRALSRSMSMLAPGRAGVRAVACDSSRKLCWALACKDGGGEPGHEPSDGVSRSVAWTESEGALGALAADTGDGCVASMLSGDTGART